MIGGIEHLIGYYTAKTAIDVLMLKGYLRESLSEFMVPATFIQLEKFPLTNNGKVNRKVTAREIFAGSSAEYYYNILPRNGFPKADRGNHGGNARYVT